jgi:hypothetical protein
MLSLHADLSIVAGGAVCSGVGMLKVLVCCDRECVAMICVQLLRQCACIVQVPRRVSALSIAVLCVTLRMIALFSNSYIEADVDVIEV